MAKSDSIFEVNGTFGGVTFVRSRTYGDHVRLKRGTHKAAKVNDAFKRESKMLLSANIPAKILKDAINPYRGVLADGLLWQRMVSVFRKQLKDSGTFDFGKLSRFEIHTVHTFEKLLGGPPSISLKKNKSILHVDFDYKTHPVFQKAKGVDGYQLSAIGIFPDIKKKTATTVAVLSEVIKLTSPVIPIRLQIPVPPKLKTFVVCARIEGYIRAVPSSMRTTNGLAIVGCGHI